MALQFYHIVPSNYLRKIQSGKLLLAHLVESDSVYAQHYNELPSEETILQYMDIYNQTREQVLANNIYTDPGRILDNSAFELYRAGLPMFDGNKMIELGRKVGAEYLVLPDYPAEDPQKTIQAAQEFAPKFKAVGFKTFFVPQGRIGSFEDYADAFAWAAQTPLVDYIGVSIIAGPNVFGVDKPGSIQTYLSRITLCEMLEKRGLITLAKHNDKKIHFLGMTDGPKEILEARRFNTGFIDSWDSSAATWAGINDIEFDNSPTGLINGKVKSHVDFAIEFDKMKLPLISKNIATIDDYVRQYNVHYN